MAHAQDTIAAIATALSDSGIGIIRISGKNAVEIADKLYVSGNGKKRLKDVESHTIHYGFIMDEKEVADEVMVSVMRAPKSYTSEDTVEINCHGGVMMMNRILELVLKAGARMAEPGEFTKRAFLNGRIDLSKAEAVMDVIAAQSELSLKSSVSQLSGSLSEKIRKMREKILYEIAFIESALDDPEHISLEGYPDSLKQIVDNVLEETQKLLSSFDDGKLIKEGINTVIVGKPNVGKSSFLNLMLGEERAIVTEIAGTTRDILKEQIRIGGINLNVVDTAGIRFTEDTVEKIGVQKAKEYAKNADLILYVIDGSVMLDENDTDIIKIIEERNCIVLLNKSDLDFFVTEKQVAEQFHSLGFSTEHLHVIRISAKDGTGLAGFAQTVKEMFFHGEISFENEVYITNMRHKEALLQTKESLLLVEKSLLDNMPEDFYAIDLMNAYTSLGLIIGESVEDDLVEEIFSKFCMGK